jgi:hypothetical protein
MALQKVEHLRADGAGAACYQYGHEIAPCLIQSSMEPRYAFHFYRRWHH